MYNLIPLFQATYNNSYEYIQYNVLKPKHIISNIHNILNRLKIDDIKIIHSIKVYIEYNTHIECMHYHLSDISKKDSLNVYFGFEKAKEISFKEDTGKGIMITLSNEMLRAMIIIVLNKSLV
jgi:hypothetical protein